MPTFQSLLQAVLDSPDDDLPRHILGDWLLDQPDATDHARGEFLHVQCQLAKLSADDPEQTDLERRQLQLLPTSPQRWARPFRRRGVKAWSFDRGLVDGLTLRPHDFGRVADLIVSEQPVRRFRLLGDGWGARLRDWPGLARIRSLEFPDGNYADVTQLLLSPRLAGLRELTLPGWRGGSDALRNAPWLKTIETLDLRPTPYAQSGLLLPGRLPRLRALGIQLLDGLGAVLPQLRELSLSRVVLNPFVVLAQTANCIPVELESLTLDGCFDSWQMPHLGLADLLRLPALTNLRRFELRDAPLSDVQALAGLLKRGQLTRLVLHNAIVTQLRPLALYGRLANLRELAVTRTRSTPISLPPGQVEALAAADLGSLTSLSLCGYDLTVEVRYLFDAPWLDQLHTLCLRDCDLNGHGVSVILGRQWPGLARLDLRGNRLSAKQKAWLRERFGVRVRYSA